MTRHKKRTEFPALMSDGAPERAVLQDQYDFLCDLWHAPAMAGPDMFGNLCFRRKGTTKMIDKFVVLHGEIKINRLLRRYDRHRYDQYFSPNVYARPSRKLTGVHMTSLGWCDVDEADPFAFDPKPSLVWETSPGRTQALWFWDRLHTPAMASAFSKALTYRHGGDKGGSAANKLLRLPGSFNHK
ncbi:DNA-primase RepB domain-containing protein, partial [Spirulina sp. 06S082]|uniref:DNA-primase RepB domain-containing protein n=1 Tax=Spirulina sp. 06S082 TaxID=3110248 RepID=UPI002B2041CC